MPRFDWFCPIHDKALESLNSNWQVLGSLPENFIAYEDLVADRKIEYLRIGDIVRGNRHYYRLSA